MKRFVLSAALAALGLVLLQAPVVARESAKETPKVAPKESARTTHEETYLGIGVEAVPPALSSQLPGILSDGHGVLVGGIAKDSPAAKAGLQANDILLSYGDRKLTSPEQLLKLVRADKPGHEIKVEYLRGGKTATCTVTLGERQVAAPKHERIFRFLPDERLRRMFDKFETNEPGAAWESFDAMTLSRVSDKKWRADIDYRNKDGKKEHRTFEGTREEIRNAIREDKDLPANEQRHLLRALNLHEPAFEFHLPPLDGL
jgi:hypothetical protein